MSMLLLKDTICPNKGNFCVYFHVARNNDSPQRFHFAVLNSDII